MADVMYWADDGIRRALDRLTGVTGAPTIGAGSLRLYKNNPSPLPSKATVLGDLTEATFAGYAAKNLSVALWPAAAVTSHVARSTYPAQTYTRTSTGAAESIYGCYITNTANTELWLVSYFLLGPYVVTNNGDFVTVAPALTFESKN